MPFLWLSGSIRSNESCPVLGVQKLKTSRAFPNLCSSIFVPSTTLSCHKGKVGVRQHRRCMFIVLCCSTRQWQMTVQTASPDTVLRWWKPSAEEPQCRHGPCLWSYWDWLCWSKGWRAKARRSPGRSLTTAGVGQLQFKQFCTITLEVFVPSVPDNAGNRRASFIDVSEFDVYWHHLLGVCVIEGRRRETRHLSHLCSLKSSGHFG